MATDDMPAHEPAQPGTPLQYACDGCGAALEFAPGTDSMKCPYCGTLTAIAAHRRSQKQDYAAWVGVRRPPLADIEAVSISCENCGTETTTTAVSTRCRSCGSGQVVTDDMGGRLKTPDGIVAFLVDRERAGKEFASWSRSRWFAPNALRKVVRTDRMVGAYLPHWGYDDKTTTDYQGKRGDHYWDTETYTENVNGHLQTRTRQVQRTRWSHASGRVTRDFVDVLTPGVTAPDADTLEKLGPWSTDAATSYEPRFLAGFETPRYDVTADAGFADAKRQMAEQIEKDCRDDIGGDEQRVSTMTTYDADVLFRLLLMPLWIASYVFAGKTYDVYVNANTGEVIGERPYSWVKITLLVALVVAAVVVGVVLYQMSGGSSGG